jgi:hypothetical protein
MMVFAEKEVSSARLMRWDWRFMTVRETIEKEDDFELIEIDRSHSGETVPEGINVFGRLKKRYVSA